MKLHNYNDLKCTLNIAKLRLDLITKRNDPKDTIDYQKSVIKKYQQYCNDVDKSLLSLTGIQLDLYKAIVLDTMLPTRAVEKVAEDTYRDVNTIWRCYYPKIKQHLKKIEIIKEV